ncbi:MAG: hypothetical protein IKR38_07985 [Bacteroidales bacterium]|nr:hypothetical protein [Bacteroidales bacterium]
MGKFSQTVKDWMLPGAIVLGISSYLIYYFTPALRPIGPACHAIASIGQRIGIALLLFSSSSRYPRTT